VADSANEDAAEASEEVILSAPEATLEAALEASLTTEVITEVTIPLALPVALATAEERMGKAAGVPEAVAATPAQRALAQPMAEAACSASQACWAQSRIPYAQLDSLQKQARSFAPHWKLDWAIVAMLLTHN
jgi:hypothetical protein